MRPVRFGILLAHHFTLSTLSVFLDYVRSATDIQEAGRSRPEVAEWTIMAPRLQPIAASCGVTIDADSELLGPAAFDYILVIGGRPGTEPEFRAEVLAYLRQADRMKTTLIGICTGTFALCRAGAMIDRTCCVSWNHSREFMEAFPRQSIVTDRLLLCDRGRITCAGGATGAAALANHLIRTHFGRPAAERARAFMHLRALCSARPVAPHPQVPGPIKDARIHRCLLLMEQNMSRPLPIYAIARSLRVSVRQLERLCRRETGSGPAALYDGLRMRYALWLLENTDRSLLQVALKTGFSDRAQFTRRFTTRYGRPPSQYRSAFSPRKL